MIGGGTGEDVYAFTHEIGIRILTLILEDLGQQIHHELLQNFKINHAILRFHPSSLDWRKIVLTCKVILIIRVTKYLFVIFLRF